MENALKDLPPEQRQMMEQYMKGMTPGKAPEITYKKVATGQKVGAWTTMQYQGTREGEKVSEVWTADWKALGLAKEDFTVLQDMSKFWESMIKSSQGFFKVEGETVDFPGLTSAAESSSLVSVKIVDTPRKY